MSNHRPGATSSGEAFATLTELIQARCKEKGGEITKTEMSFFATQLHEGKLIAENLDDPMYIGKKVKLSYNKRQFYDRILTPMKSMGIIDYDLYKKTYKLSEKFNKNMMRIGLMWLQELRKPPLAFSITKPQK